MNLGTRPPREGYVRFLPDPVEGQPALIDNLALAATLAVPEPAAGFSPWA